MHKVSNEKSNEKLMVSNCPLEDPSPPKCKQSLLRGSMNPQKERAPRQQAIL